MQMPDRIAKLPTYKGYPITASTLIENDIPNFRAVDSSKIAQFKKEKKCSICGEPLDYWISFMVTEEEAKNQLIFESPTHEDCLKYSFTICPWLKYSKAKYSNIEHFKSDHYKAIASRPNEGSNDRPTKLGIYTCRSYQDKLIRQGNLNIRVCKVPPAKKIEWIEVE